MFYDDLKNLIFAELPGSWDWFRKAKVADKIIDMVKAHCGKMQAELNDLDGVIDDMALELKALRDGWLYAREDVRAAIERAMAGPLPEVGDEYVEKLADQFIAERGEKANGGCLDAVKQAVYADFYGWYIRRASHG